MGNVYLSFVISLLLTSTVSGQTLIRIHEFSMSPRLQEQMQSRPGKTQAPFGDLPGMPGKIGGDTQQLQQKVKLLEELAARLKQENAELRAQLTALGSK